MSPSVTILTRKRETKGTWLYEADPNSPSNGTRNLYIDKRILNGSPAPEKIKLTIEPAS
jgi:hypothetical protein